MGNRLNIAIKRTGRMSVSTKKRSQSKCRPHRTFNLRGCTSVFMTVAHYILQPKRGLFSQLRVTSNVHIKTNSKQPHRSSNVSKCLFCLLTNDRISHFIPRKVFILMELANSKPCNTLFMLWLIDNFLWIKLELNHSAKH